jgi:hypothetical protein
LAQAVIQDVKFPGNTLIQLKYPIADGVSPAAGITLYLPQAIGLDIVTYLIVCGSWEVLETFAS